MCVVSSRRQRRELTQEQMEFILGEDTLRMQAGLTLKERAAMFADKFQVEPLPVTTLRRVYLQNGVKRKRVRQKKVPPQSAQSRQTQEERRLYREMTAARQTGKPIIYLDEVNFTKRSFQGVDWSARNANITVDQRQIYTSYKSVLASINWERGKGLEYIFDKAIRQEQFMMYLKALHGLFGRQPIIIMMDNLWVHKDPEVMDLYKRLKITPIFNVGYAPDFNPIESTFSIVKRQYCKQRLHCLANNIAFDPT